MRDFSVYVVNSFDLAVAENFFSSPSSSSSFPPSSSSILYKYMDIKLKNINEEEWLERPVPPHLISAGIEEVHFFPFLAICLYNRLAASSSK
ncbi:hypothetical protein, conserved [Eimeria maxima]|uniref:Uncharacterized protein n=1 Tax=Eimeria maxima TaxID=5804 RepID=U6M0K0_EIMMA|nr:hypothetical protein, conserved [Eimeria maxima]CDJ56603.1 hypothetical protein, conserved [Eimeria maxima]